MTEKLNLSIASQRVRELSEQVKQVSPEAAEDLIQSWVSLQLTVMRSMVVSDQLWQIDQFKGVLRDVHPMLSNREEKRSLARVLVLTSLIETQVEMLQQAVLN